MYRFSVIRRFLDIHIYRLITRRKLLIDARERVKLSMEAGDIRVTEQQCRFYDTEDDTNIEHVTDH